MPPKTPQRSLLSRAATSNLADRVLHEANVVIDDSRAVRQVSDSYSAYDPDDPFELDAWLRLPTAPSAANSHTRQQPTTLVDKIFSAPPGSVWQRILARRRAVRSTGVEARTTLSTTPTDRQASRSQSELESSGPQISAVGGQVSGLESGLHAIAEAYDGESQCSSPSATSSVLDFTMQHALENMPGSRSASPGTVVGSEVARSEGSQDGTQGRRRSNRARSTDLPDVDVLNRVTSEEPDLLLKLPGLTKHNLNGKLGI